MKRLNPSIILVFMYVCAMEIACFFCYGACIMYNLFQ